MNVLILAPYRFDTAPGQRFRVEQWMPLMEREGVHFSFDAFLSETLQKVLYQPGHIMSKIKYMARDFGRRLLAILEHRKVDVVFLHREAAMLGPAILERLLGALSIPFVYDFDDAIYVPYVSPSNGIFSYLKFPQKTGTICRLASRVIVGNDVLFDYARDHTAEDRITIVPTTIDTDKYRRVGSRRDEVLTIGWSGSYSSVQYLDVAKPALQKLAQTHRFRLLVIGAKFECPGVEVECIDWRAATEVEDLSRIDLGVMPLVDDVWARGKCALKALQYMALGIPTVVSPVGVNSAVIRDGQNGLHATDEAAWLDGLGRLLKDAPLRRRLGEAGKQTVEEEYSARVHAPRVLSVLRAAQAS